ncbi:MULTISPECIES: type II toxin-antitoxin system RelE/ParE family toxin [unclassified Caballeronia]|uniref:type II toxin-antitoxin system RelE/ParE family toxin n=1 Tax=unclassified Caballeronia TaxID=2646786 RepID=UPI0032EAC767
MIVRILPAAEAELEAIGDFIDNPRRALSFVLEMRDKCMSLADMPSPTRSCLGTKTAACAIAFTAATRFSLVSPGNPSAST